MGLLTGVSSCLLIRPAAGITKLSELIIDADKNWAAKGISNIKEVAAGMAHGDVPFRGSTSISKLTAAAAGNFLQTCGPGRAPWWRIY